MAGTARPNHPGGPQPAEPAPLDAGQGDVRRLQNRLWAAAKQSPGRRFHALYDRIHRSDVLWEAWARVRANRGAAGVDRLTLEAVEDYGVGRPSVSRVRENRTHGLKGGWGNVPVLPVARP